MTFTQQPPQLDNQYHADRTLRSTLRRLLPGAALEGIEPELDSMGELAAELFELQQSDRRNEPRLIRWDAWGNRVDRIQHTAVWKRAREIAVDYGLVAIPYAEPPRRWHRLHQFSLAYLFGPSSDVYNCPLAMSDGAAKTLLESGNTALIETAVPKLTSRDTDQFWTSGQWMTETTGGSDVGRARTEARRENGVWRLYGRKWFASAPNSEMALALARPEGNPEGTRGLALFYVRTRDENGEWQNIRVQRLKDKLGTRKLPTAELRLEGTPAVPVGDTEHGVKRIAPMLNITRTWNAVSAVGTLRRGVALARDYATRREAFGSKLSRKPLHVETLSNCQALLEGAFQLTFRLVALLGEVEADNTNPRQRLLLRLLTPLVKLQTARQTVRTSSEVLELFGGAGYLEDTGLPVLLRDSQVYPIWEGTTNVLALDLLRTLRTEEGMDVLEGEIHRSLEDLASPELRRVGDRVSTSWHQTRETLEDLGSQPAREAYARPFALRVGNLLETALLAEHAQWCLREDADERPRAAAVRLARLTLGDDPPFDLKSSFALANDQPLEDVDPP